MIQPPAYGNHQKIYGVSLILQLRGLMVKEIRDNSYKLLQELSQDESIGRETLIICVFLNNIIQLLSLMVIVPNKEEALH